MILWYISKPYRQHISLGLVTVKENHKWAALVGIELSPSIKTTLSAAGYILIHVSYDVQDRIET